LNTFHNYYYNIFNIVLTPRMLIMKHTVYEWAPPPLTDKPSNKRIMKKKKNVQVHYDGIIVLLLSLSTIYIYIYIRVSNNTTYSIVSYNTNAKRENFFF
jgi:hypothetical protein